MQEKIEELLGERVDESWFEYNWKAVYLYLSTHTVEETRKYFGEGIIRIILN